MSWRVRRRRSRGRHRAGAGRGTIALTVRERDGTTRNRELLQVRHTWAVVTKPCAGLWPACATHWRSPAGGCASLSCLKCPEMRRPKNSTSGSRRRTRRQGGDPRTVVRRNRTSSRHGLDESTVRPISAKRTSRWMLDWRQGGRCGRRWRDEWAKRGYPAIDTGRYYYARRKHAKLARSTRRTEIIAVYESSASRSRSRRCRGGRWARQVAATRCRQRQRRNHFREEKEGGRDLPVDQRGDP